MRVDYSRVVESVAMSKRPNQNGMVIVKDGDKVFLHATNPKTNEVTSYLMLQIPIEDIDKVIDALNKIKYE